MRLHAQSIVDAELGGRSIAFGAHQGRRTGAVNVNRTGGGRSREISGGPNEKVPGERRAGGQRSTSVPTCPGDHTPHHVRSVDPTLLTVVAHMTLVGHGTRLLVAHSS